MDPHTAVSPHAIRKLVLSGTIPHISVGTKRLISLDGLLEYLAAPASPVVDKPGQIRPVREKGA